MFDSDRATADVTLCIFPHLKEFIAIDAREALTIHVLVGRTGDLEGMVAERLADVIKALGLLLGTVASIISHFLAQPSGNGD